MINLTKGNVSVSLEKVLSFSVDASWPAATDYDLGAEILYKDGTTESLATFGAAGTSAKPQSRNGTVTLSGDVGRGAGVAVETMSIDWDDEIEQIAPWVYSAQSNGTGSFRKHQVTTTVNAGQTVQIKAEDASKNDSVYTLVPALITFKDGEMQVEYAEMYSIMTSENRPQYKRSMLGKVKLSMNGPRNSHK